MQKEANVGITMKTKKKKEEKKKEKEKKIGLVGWVCREIRLAQWVSLDMTLNDSMVRFQ